MLTALNDHLRDELEESGKKHKRALGNLTSRLGEAQREAERQRAQREVIELRMQVRPLRTGRVVKTFQVPQFEQGRKNRMQHERRALERF